MEFFNKIDDRGRFYGLDVYDGNGDGQKDSHGISYLGARKLIEELYGKNIGLGIREINDE